MDDCAALKEILEIAQKSLLLLEKKAAGHTSLSIPSDLSIELNDKRQEVEELKSKIAADRSTKQDPQPLVKVELSHQSLMRSKVPDKHYIERDEAKRLRQSFAAALKKHQEQPLLFNICGIGGVGKTTLLGRLKDDHAAEVDFLEICFAKTREIETPLKLMRKLHQQGIELLLLGGLMISDTFTEQNRQFEATLFELSQYSIDGSANSREDAKKITSWFERSIWLGVIGLTATASKPISLDISGAGFPALTSVGEDMEGWQEWIQQRVRNHPATKDRPDLQSLMLEPVAKLTQAFANSMMQIAQSRGRSIVLVLDTYEKAQPYLNQWLWQSLVEDTSLSSAPVRLVVIGRRPLQSDESWRKLHQDRQLLHETQLSKFSKKYTEDYLNQIGIENRGIQAKIYKATKGLPYYLNWVRDQKEKGSEPDFSKGNQAIAELLLQGLDAPQRKILQVFACCRWFDRSMIRDLIKNDAFGLQQDANNAENYFEWLKKSDFIDSTEGHYCLDDVARDVFRQAYFQDDRNQFRKTNAMLADYFKKQADETVDPQSLLPDPYEDEDWRKSISEFLYYGLFGKGREGLIQYIEHVFVSAYLRQPDVSLAPFAFICAEMSEENKYLLPTATDKFFKDSSMAIGLGAHALNVYPITYEFKSEDKNMLSEKDIEVFSKQVETSIQHLLGYVKDSREDSLGKCIGLLYKSLRSSTSTNELEVLKQSKDMSDKLSIYCHSKLISSILSNICDLLVISGHYEYSLNCYQKILNLNQGSTSIFIGQGFALLSLKRYDEALESFEKAIELDSKSVEALVNQGVALLSLDRDKDTIKGLQKAISIDPGCVSARLSIGNAFINLERYEEALENSQEVIDINPESINAWTIKGSSLFGLEKYEEALESYQQAISLDPNSVDAWTNKGATLLQLSRYDEALETSLQAINIDPKGSSAWMNKGSALLSLGKQAEALEDYQKAIELSPESIDTWINRGSVLLKLGKHVEALEDYQKAIEISPKSIKDWINQGNAFTGLSQHEDALESYQKAIELSPKSINAWINQGSALFNLERYKESLESYQQVIKLNPKSINAWINQGFVLSRLSRHEDALSSYQKAISIDPKSVDFLMNKRALLFDLERYEDALAISQLAIDLDPQSINILIDRGIEFSSLERYEEAITSYKTAIEIDSQSASAWNRLSVTLISLRRYDEALIACDRALEIDDKDFDTLNTQSLVLSLLKKFEEAIISIDKAILIEPQKVLLEANRAIILARADRYNEAFIDCDRAIEQNPNHEIGYYAKACCHALQDEIELAVKHLQQAIDIKPRLCRKEAKHNPDFDSIRDDKQFRALVYLDS
jgi:tetratricopeptide (TPR) repeat protein